MKKQAQQQIPENHVEAISTEEIQQAIREMKNGKSSGSGGIPIKILKHANTSIHEILTYIFNRCLLNHDKLPQDWKVRYLTPIYKKRSRHDCSNYREISGLATMGRPYGHIVRRRIGKKIAVGEEQSVFTGIDNIFSLKQITEKSKIKSLETYLIFIDLEKAFDVVSVKKLFKILDKSNINKQPIFTIKQIYEGQTNIIKINNRLSAPFTTNKGLRQAAAYHLPCLKCI
ncbi:hypothetical protein ILUMI_10037 [Ignelater luminosus]|uniref:Reverse transcriptase domain-containing protein n=1 Tax=Ignelater luminosus TaxID=2038154 RepID=A0A8K0CYV9_IGNLU|nr:hypothetical protein ILUMI_10037 [Ignelater luminosus]